jgi:probable HAF family extracellular repeat protein
MEFLGTLGGSINVPGENSFGNSVSAAFGINTIGQVTGQSSTTSQRWHGFLYTDGIGMQDLGVLQGDDTSVGIEINDSGHIVGNSWNVNVGINHPVLWTRPGCLEDLNAAPGVKGSGWILGDTRAINNKGQIVGNGTNPAGKASGYRLTPVATSRATQCSVASGAIEPKDWKRVRPFQRCTTNACKAKLAKNRSLLKKKALIALKAQKAAEKAPINARKQATARKSRNQYERVISIISIIQSLHN